MDLVDFTSRADQADPEDVRALMVPYDTRVKSEIESFGGVVEKFIGDAVMAVFGAPVSHGDDAERAVRAGLRVLDAVQELNREDPAFDLTVRVAVNTGEAIAQSRRPWMRGYSFKDRWTNEPTAFGSPGPALDADSHEQSPLRVAL